MSPHNVLRAIAACAPGKRVKVTYASGKTLVLPVVPVVEPPAPPHPIEVLAQQLAERDVQMRASIEERAGETFAAVKDAVEAIVSAQERVVESVEENTRTLHLPVKPVYFPDGKLRHAQRAEKG
jgi:hypothetical protein